MTEQLPDDQMQLLVADAVRYRFLRDVVPLIIKDCIADKFYDWDNHSGFDFITYDCPGETLNSVYGEQLDSLIDKELGILVDREIAEKIKETP
jgi:hypothetical protein